MRCRGLLDDAENNLESASASIADADDHLAGVENVRFGFPVCFSSLLRLCDLLEMVPEFRGYRGWRSTPSDYFY